MAEVFVGTGRNKTTRVVALHVVTQRELDSVTKHRAALARRFLAERANHRQFNGARIVTSSGKIDRYVTLDDTRDDGAAMSIEFGRHPHENGRGGMEGLHVLRDAFPEAGI